MDHWKMIITTHRFFIVYQSLVSAPQPMCCTSEPTELGCGNPSSFHWRMQGTTFYSLTVSYERTQTKTNNCTTSFLPTLAIHFVYQDFPFPFILHYYNTVPNYHRQSIKNYKSDQIEQQLTSNKRISTISPVLALVLVASAWTTINFSTYKLLPTYFQATGNDNNSSKTVPMSTTTCYYCGSSLLFC